MAFLKVFNRFLFAGAVGHPTDQLAYLVDDFCMIESQCSMCISVPGLDFQHARKGIQNFPPDTLLQGFYNGYALAVAAQVECIEMVAVGFTGKFR